MQMAQTTSPLACPTDESTHQRSQLDLSTLSMACRSSGSPHNYKLSHIWSHLHNKYNISWHISPFYMYKIFLDPARSSQTSQFFLPSLWCINYSKIPADKVHPLLYSKDSYQDCNSYDMYKYEEFHLFVHMKVCCWMSMPQILKWSWKD